jgi:hypothetical protein
MTEDQPLAAQMSLITPFMTMCRDNREREGERERECFIDYIILKCILNICCWNMSEKEHPVFMFIMLNYACQSSCEPV